MHSETDQTGLDKLPLAIQQNYQLRYSHEKDLIRFEKNADTISLS